MIDVSQVRKLNVAIRIGAQAGTVKVYGNAVQVEQETSTLGSVFNEHLIMAIPPTNRNSTQMLHISPGVVADVANASGWSAILPDSQPHFTD
jgi:hypothetical protein